MSKKKALIAIGHKILTATYHILKKKEPYKELGADFLKNKKRDKLIARHKKQLEELGLEITIRDNNVA